MKKIKVSIIVPVYNVERYLGRCLDSILMQSYKNFEVICINDGSKDNSKKILKMYECRDSRVKVFSKDNGGLPSARNFGFQYITGDLVMFVDSDDWLDFNCLEICVSKFMAYNLDCVIFPYIREYKYAGKKTYTLGQQGKLYDEKDSYKIRRRFFGLTDLEVVNPMKTDELNTAWGKLYRRQCIQDVRFTDVEIIGSAEDCFFNLQAFKNIKRIYYTIDTFYHYNKQNETSIIHTYDERLLQTRLTLFSYIRDCIIREKLSPQYNRCLENRVALTVFTLNRNIVNANICITEKKIKIDRVLNEFEIARCLKLLKLDNLELKWKIYFMLCKRKYIIALIIMTRVAEKLKQLLR